MVMLYFINDQYTPLFEAQVKELSINKELITYQVNRDNILSVASDLNSIDLFNNERLFVLYNLDFFYLKKHSFLKKQVETILHALNICPEDIIIVLTKPLDYKNNFFQQLDQKCQYIDIQKTEQSINDYLAKVINLYQIKITTENLNILKYNLDNDIVAISSELVKLSTFNLEITAKIIAELSYKTVSANAFKLIEYIITKRNDSARNLFKQLIEDGEDPFGLLGLCAKQIQFYYQVKILMATQSQKQIISRLNANPYRVSITMKVLQNIPIKSIRQIYINIAKTDYQIKNGLLQADFIIDNIIQY